MGQFRFDDPKKQEKEKVKIHPIWRGVGFVMMIIIPIISYAATEVLIKQNMISNWFPWPYDLFAKPGEFLYNGDYLLYLKIILTVAFSLLIYAIFTLVTFVLSSAFGRTRLGPYDAPPINAKVRKKAR
jgi:hypothetical protein